MIEFFSVFFAVMIAGFVVCGLGFLIFKFLEFMFEVSDGAWWGLLVYFGVMILIFATLAGLIAVVAS